METKRGRSGSMQVTHGHQYNYYIDETRFENMIRLLRLEIMITGIHAREWVSPTSGLYTIHQIIQSHLNSRSGNPFDEDVVGIDWYIMPLLNPDGYEYSHTHDRMWRKNRSPEGKIKILISPGVLFKTYYVLM